MIFFKIFRLHSSSDGNQKKVPKRSSSLCERDLNRNSKVFFTDDTISKTDLNVIDTKIYLDISCIYLNNEELNSFTIKKCICYKTVMANFSNILLIHGNGTLTMMMLSIGENTL